MPAQSRELFPVLPAVLRNEQGGILHSGVNRVRIGERGLQMPDALELPWVRRAVVPLVCAWNAVINEFVPHRFPGFAAVVRPLDHLPRPSARLRRVQPIRVNRRAFEVIHLPARKMWTRDVPLFALSVRRQNKCAFARSNQHPYTAHLSSSLFMTESASRLRHPPIRSAG